MWRGLSANDHAVVGAALLLWLREFEVLGEAVVGFPLPPFLAGDIEISPEKGHSRMSDLVIRDIPDEVLAALDQRAARLGLSRAEYVRRRLAQDAAMAAISVTADDWQRFAAPDSDLGDSEVIGQAWE